MKYVTFSYDDNACLNEKLLEILGAYGARCTFNLNSGMITPGKLANFFLGSRRMGSLADMKALLAGTPHEIACHGEKHLDLTKLPADQIGENLRHDRAALETLFDREICGFAYPYGAYSELTTAALENCGFRYARTTTPTHDFGIPRNFLTWDPTCHHNDKELFPLAEKFIRENGTEDRIFCVWGHAWEYGVFHNWTRLMELLELLKGDASIQYVTNEELCRKMTTESGNQ